MWNRSIFWYMSKKGEGVSCWNTYGYLHVQYFFMSGTILQSCWWFQVLILNILTLFYLLHKGQNRCTAMLMWFYWFRKVAVDILRLLCVIFELQIDQLLYHPERALPALPISDVYCVPVILLLLYISGLCSGVPYSFWNMFIVTKIHFFPSLPPSVCYSAH